MYNVFSWNIFIKIFIYSSFPCTSERKSIQFNYLKTISISDTRKKLTYFSGKSILILFAIIRRQNNLIRYMPHLKILPNKLKCFFKIFHWICVRKVFWMKDVYFLLHIKYNVLHINLQKVYCLFLKLKSFFYYLSNISSGFYTLHFKKKKVWFFI